MIMQGYDFVELNRRYGTVLQMGGSDQWGNIINGVDLSHRMGGAQLYALTTPLLTKSSGEKMGKSASGAVWLNGDLFSPYDFWQYFRNTEDADVGKFLKIFTRLPLDEIARLEALGGSELNEAKKILATEVTAIVHGREAAEAGRRDRPRDLRGRRARPVAADRRDRHAASSTPAWACSPRSSPRALPPRTAKPAATSSPAPCASTTSPPPTNAPPSPPPTSSPKAC